MRVRSVGVGGDGMLVDAISSSIAKTTVLILVLNHLEVVLVRGVLRVRTEDLTQPFAHLILDLMIKHDSLHLALGLRDVVERKVMNLVSEVHEFPIERVLVAFQGELNAPRNLVHEQVADNCAAHVLSVGAAHIRSGLFRFTLEIPRRLCVVHDVIDGALALVIRRHVVAEVEELDRGERHNSCLLAQLHVMSTLHSRHLNRRIALSKDCGSTFPHWHEHLAPRAPFDAEGD
mmetsp:Transcript_18/g.39  ORF Transcript_18/g.39 Transcript_18/m.39 type:complete len:232 (+) Transcript_18:310-1005(+)